MFIHIPWIFNGNRKPGHQNTWWVDTIKADTRQNIKQLKETVKDWNIWRDLASRIINSQT